MKHIYKIHGAIKNSQIEKLRNTYEVLESETYVKSTIVTFYYPTNNFLYDAEMYLRKEFKGISISNMIPV